MATKSRPDTKAKSRTAGRVMGRRAALRATAATGVALLTATRPAPARQKIARTRPNILLFHCHDLGQFLHCYGVKTVRTPNLDAFAEQGVLFTNSYCTAPQCSPSRASLFTGRYPHSNGVMGLCHADFAWDLHPTERHLAQILKDLGYTTEAIGVIHETRAAADRCGYDRHDHACKASEAATAAIASLERFAQHPEQPFFLSCGCLEPHRLPSQDPDADMGFLTPEFAADDSLGVEVPGYLRDTPGTRTELAELQGSVHHMDAQFGRVLEALRATSLDTNTLVIFTTDHGYAMPRAKCSLYDPGLAVALILRLPTREGWHGGTRHHALVSNVDYVPTLMDLLGVPTPKAVQGKSFAALLDGKSAYAPRTEVFGEISHHDYHDPRRCIRTKTHKLILNFSAAPAFMDPSQSWRPRSDTVEPKNHALAYHPCCELYDLTSDPWELHNLADEPEHAEVRDKLLARLRKHLVDTNDPILQGAITPPMHHKALKLLGA